MIWLKSVGLNVYLKGKDYETFVSASFITNPLHEPKKFNAYNLN